jgi:hypothetical protein
MKRKIKYAWVSTQGQFDPKNAPESDYSSFDEDPAPRGSHRLVAEVPPCNQETGDGAISDSAFRGSMIQGGRCDAEPFSPRINFPSSFQ